MKYQSIDHLQDFEFHDAALKNGQIIGNTFTATLRILNIHKDTPQNNSDRDLEIKEAKITFYDFHLLTFEYGRTWYEDENGNSYTDEPQITHAGDEAHALLTEELKHGLTLYSLSHTLPNTCIFDATGVSPYFTFSFSFEHVIVEWDAYCNIAWYDTDDWREYRRQLKENENQEN